MTLVFSPEVEGEIAAAANYYAIESRNLKERFLAEVESTLRRIEEFPNAWPPATLGMRRCLCSKFPFAIIYRPVNGGIKIYAVAHQKRRPGYWKARLRG